AVTAARPGGGQGLPTTGRGAELREGKAGGDRTIGCDGAPRHRAGNAYRRARAGLLIGQVRDGAHYRQRQESTPRCLRTCGRKVVFEIKKSACRGDAQGGSAASMGVRS